MDEEVHEAVIVGAGIAGLATAIALRKVGIIQSIVLEKSHQLRTTGAAITLAPNAWRALHTLGVATKLTSIYRTFERGYVTNLITGATQEQSLKATSTDSGDGDMGVRSVHRKVLLETLANELPPNTIKFSINITSIKSQEQDITVLQLEDGSVIRTKALIGCDGVHSVVGQWLGLTAPVDSGRSGLAVFPSGHGLKHQFHQFIGNGVRCAFVSMNETDVFWGITTSHSPADGTMPREPELIQKEVIDHLAKDCPAEYLNVIRRSDLSTITWGKLMYRVPWDVLFGKTHRGGVTVAGDAFHPMTPDLGQGGCTALEDAVVLVRCLANSRGSVSSGLEMYVKERRWRVAGIITGAFLSGWVQEGGTGWRWWLVKLFRDHLFYRFVFPRIGNAVRYDCGVLPEKEKIL
ncbi:putative FAD-binding domain, FAD/NAD(P)-binding domain superfamily [Dioscorea sansibarensis]